MYYVYILYPLTYKKSYVGYTYDLERRLFEHNVLAETGYTIRFRPWEIIYTEEYENKSEAIKREKHFKTGVGRDFIKKLIQEKFPDS